MANESDAYGSSSIANFDSYLQDYYDRPHPDWGKAESYSLSGSDCTLRDPKGKPRSPGRKKVGVKSRVIPGVSVVAPFLPRRERNLNYQRTPSPEPQLRMLGKRRVVKRKRRKKNYKELQQDSSSNEFTFTSDHLVEKCPSEGRAEFDLTAILECGNSD